MLSRTADHLFWMARYMERAENTARMLDINLKTLLLPQSAKHEERAQRAVLRISELEPAFDARYADKGGPTRENVLDFLAAAPDNPSSIYACLQAARENARAVRGVLTTEAWETINFTWLEYVERLANGELSSDANSLFEWVKFRSHLSRGVTLGTALQDDAFVFTQLGTVLERADNTARILDVRFLDAENAEAQMQAQASQHAAQVLAQVQAQTQAQFDTQAGDVQVQTQVGHERRDVARDVQREGQLEDFYYWTSVLSSVSALEIYRKVYRDVVTPERVVELLMLNPNMPRSLLASLDAVCSNLALLRTEASNACERSAGKLRAELLYADIDQILESGLHAYLTQFLARVYELGNAISRTFLMLPVY
ncbi:alpha-E domain-containing protein [Pararobbsia silviterrae]|uniref:Alpha-E domain-containing protein n=1 Tax=Pararobbsia silviterrae TaxID=1792498 RepID=A0A494Y2T4_9BURK|nr:alpha-E domain-containing protein [Pararobbsia silviterrae]RKP54777.1 alpha-E domain-containing protein [Pararobbsia silviterrae]